MPFSVKDFCAFVAGAPAELRARSLDQVRDLVSQVNVSPLSLARVFGSPDLDLLCQQLGSHKAPKPPAKRGSGTVFLVTSLAPVGGHTRLLTDLIKAAGQADAVVLASDLLDEGLHELVRPLLAEVGASYEVAPARDLEQKLIWLQKRLKALNPARTVTLLHPFDSVAIAALQPGLGGEVTFVHNYDHNLALGVHLPNALHADLHCKGVYDCRDIEGLTGNVLWPLVADDPGPPPQRDFLDEGHPVTCTAGGFEKFSRFFVEGAQPHLNAYLRVLPRMMLAGGGRHLHVGPLPPDYLDALKTRLSEVGVPADRFSHCEYAPNLTALLRKEKVDVYVGSFPVGGGRATLEAMAAGLPLIIHDNYQSAHLSVVDEIYPGAMVWRTPEELEAIVSGLTRKLLQRHSARSRAHYERNHRPALLAEALHGKTLGCRRPLHPLDRLQAHFDLEASVADAIDKQVYPWSQRGSRPQKAG